MNETSDPMNDSLVDRLRALREQLQQLESVLAGRSALTEPAWIELDEEGAVAALSAAALVQFALDPETSVGVPLSALLDVQGDPLTDTFLCVRTGVDLIPALRVPGARREPYGTPDRILFGRAGTMPATLPAALVQSDVGRQDENDDDEAGEPESAAELERQFRHDLANIHGIIRGHAELLAMELDSERVTRTTTEILEAVRRAQRMIAERR